MPSSGEGSTAYEMLVPASKLGIAGMAVSAVGLVAILFLRRKMAPGSFSGALILALCLLIGSAVLLVLSAVDVVTAVSPGVDDPG